MGFLKPDQGSCTVLGLDSWTHSEEIKKHVGYIPGEIAFPDVDSGSDFLKIQADLMGLKSMDHADYVINKMQLDPTAKLKRMSKGMKQKTAIVEAFMAEPEILILDEPTTGLDPLMRDAFLSLITEEKARGATVFMSSHIFSEMEQTCDYVGFIKDGHLIRVVDMKDIRERADALYRLEFSSAEDYLRFESQKPFPIFAASASEKKLTIQVPNAQIHSLFVLLTSYHLASFSEVKYTLEQCFDEIVEKGD
jgi:ABC-2 type transport system ATP-binding protein